MLILNADDWGRSRAETDMPLACHESGSLTSVSAMVFMADSERAAEIAKERGINVGLHLNLTESFTGKGAPVQLQKYQTEIARFLKSSRLAPALYHPALRRQFRYVCEAQLAEFTRLYRQQPSHVDGHQHMHLCANVVFSPFIPGGLRMRRNFSFWPGQKSPLNIGYRRLIDRYLSTRYRMTDYFMDLSECLEPSEFRRVVELAKRASVELMTHPERESEKTFLTSAAFPELLGSVRVAISA